MSKDFRIVFYTENTNDKNFAHFRWKFIKKELIDKEDIDNLNF